MPALIYLDLDHLHPVIDGVWHRACFVTFPVPGEAITTLCGETAAVAFEPLGKRREFGPPTQCPFCDVNYRRLRHLTIPKGHPGLIPR
ncbi:hypothetical protein [Amycolatopsis sp. cg13]|uniref:hypothetical protein n=1 Tax=Amycolatopsis sp. cg13 TaxID=3238807 RepID=UPI00352550A2